MGGASVRVVFRMSTLANTRSFGQDGLKSGLEEVAPQDSSGQRHSTSPSPPPPPAPLPPFLRPTGVFILGWSLGAVGGVGRISARMKRSGISQPPININRPQLSPPLMRPGGAAAESRGREPGPAQRGGAPPPLCATWICSASAGVGGVFGSKASFARVVRSLVRSCKIEQ